MLLVFLKSIVFSDCLNDNELLDNRTDFGK